MLIILKNTMRHVVNMEILSTAGLYDKRDIVNIVQDIGHLKNY